MTVSQRAMSAVIEAAELARDKRYSIDDLRVSGPTLVTLRMDWDVMRSGLLACKPARDEFMGFPVVVDRSVPAGTIRIVVRSEGRTENFDFTLSEGK